MEFETPEAAQAAYDSMQGQSVDGREIYVDFASERRDGAFSSFFFWWIVNQRILWEGIFQSGNFEHIRKVFPQNTGKVKEFQTNVTYYF